MILGPSSTPVIYRVGHMCCGIGAGAKGFNDANPRVRGISAKWECAGGIDVDAPGLRQFERLTGAKGSRIDLFSREQYFAFHGKAPPPDWREATPDDICDAYGSGKRLDALFASFPCKGFSGLLSAATSGTDKYQALNGLTLRGLWLALEAYKDEPIRIILFENVPRIRTRGRWLLDQIQALLRAYGYVFVESEHDCGEIGGLGQSRKRFLMIARRMDSVPNCVYQPEKKRLRGVGEIIGRLPLPGDPVAGDLHRVPRLQWRTWVRLAFVPAGRDWRALNDLRVQDGVLTDYGIVPDEPLRDNALGVNRWEDTAPLITGARAPGQGRFSVADPRAAGMHNDGLGVRAWSDEARVVASASRPHNGAHSVADPRPTQGNATYQQYGVKPWDENSIAVSGQSAPGGGPYSVADPRVDGHPRSVQLGVKGWDETAGVVKGKMDAGQGPYSVSDPRLHRVAHSNVYRVVAFADASIAVTSSRDGAVADPRPSDSGYDSRKYRVTPYDQSTRTVIGASTTGDGAYAVADPRGPLVADAEGRGRPRGKYPVTDWTGPAPAVIAGRDNGASAVADPRGGPDPKKLHGNWRVEGWDDTSKAVIGGRKDGASAVADPRPTHGAGAHHNKMRVVSADDPAPTVTTSDRVGSGALSVADPRTGLAADRPGYQTQAHYGVQPWDSPSLAVPGHAKHDRGRWSVADPREQQGEAIEDLPKPDERLVARIISLDNTWHRPFTTLELAALQSLFDPDDVFRHDAELNAWSMVNQFDLGSGSDATKREWIGNAVPSEAARGMATTIGETLLLADMGETFTLSSREIWVKPLALALAVDPRQQVYGEMVG